MEEEISTEWTIRANHCDLQDTNKYCTNINHENNDEGLNRIICEAKEDS